MHVIIYHLLGEGNLIEEQTEIINKCEAPEPGAESGGAVPVMIIGNNNVFEVLSSPGPKPLAPNPLVSKPKPRGLG